MMYGLFCLLLQVMMEQVFLLVVNCARSFQRIHSPKSAPIRPLGGYFFGIIAGTISGIIIAKYFKLPHHYHFLAFVACLLAIAGDLLNSKFKRSHEIKDSGQGLFTENLLPGHGGIYDRFDSISLACISWVFLGILGFI